VGIDESIADLRSVFPRQFALVDGIVGMEGNGPIQGTPKYAGVLVAGRDMAAVDATCCRIMRIDPQNVAYLRLAAEAGGQIAEHAIHQLDEKIAAVATPFTLLLYFHSYRLGSG
jgi:uncharacterized protein (DUF362 family)